MSQAIIQSFDFEGSQFRNVSKSDVAEIVASDVAKILGYGSAKDMTRTLDDDEKGTREVPTLGGVQKMTVITESGLFKAIMQRELAYVKDPTAKAFVKRFQRWVTHEVLPQIRRTGGYIPTTEADDEKTILAKAMIISQRTMEMQKLTIQRQKTRLDVVEPKARALDDLTNTEHLYTLTEAAQLLNNGGEGFGLKRLTNWLRANKWIRRENKGNAPYQDKIDSGLLATKAYKARFNPDNGDYTTFTPKILVTAKGIARLYRQIYGISKTTVGEAA